MQVRRQGKLKSHRFRTDSRCVCKGCSLVGPPVTPYSVGFVVRCLLSSQRCPSITNPRETVGMGQKVCQHARMRCEVARCTTTFDPFPRAQLHRRRHDCSGLFKAGRWNTRAGQMANQWSCQMRPRCQMNSKNKDANPEHPGHRRAKREKSTKVLIRRRRRPKRKGPSR